MHNVWHIVISTEHKQQHYITYASLK